VGVKNNHLHVISEIKYSVSENQHYDTNTANNEITKIELKEELLFDSSTHSKSMYVINRLGKVKETDWFHGAN